MDVLEHIDCESNDRYVSEVIEDKMVLTMILCVNHCTNWMLQ